MSVRQDVPVYRLLGPFFSPIDKLHPEGECIAWGGVPNADMEPLNEKARVVLHDYFTEQEQSGRAAAEKAGKAYAGPVTIDVAIANAHSEARRVSLKDGDGGVPVMGGKKLNTPLIETVDDPSTFHHEVVEDLTLDTRRGPGRPKGS